MRAPKFYLRIKEGYFMAGLHGYSVKRNAEEFMEKWIKTMIASGIDTQKAYDAIRIEKVYGRENKVLN